MYRWCSFCQKFIGESKPRDNYSLTHGICADCKPKLIEGQTSSTESLKDVIRFFESLQALALRFSQVSPKEIVAEARRLHIQPTDFLAGMIQPILYEIGARWQRGELTVVTEHLFSRFVNELLAEIQREYPNPVQGQPYRGLLAVIPGNHHEFGVRFLELFLQQNHVPCLGIYPDAPWGALKDLAKLYQVKWIGLSVNSFEQFDALLPELQKTTEFQIMIGGRGVHQAIFPKNFSHLHVNSGDLQEFLNWAKKH